MNAVLRLGRRGAVTLCMALATGGLAPAQAAGDPCAPTDHLPPARLSGEWQLTLWPLQGSDASPVDRGTVWLERHPEFTGSVRGRLQRGQADAPRTAVVSGDVVDGQFHLEESADGVSMDAVWSGEPADCARVLQGERRPAEGRPGTEGVLRFRLEKRPGWR